LKSSFLQSLKDTIETISTRLKNKTFFIQFKFIKFTKKYWYSTSNAKMITIY
jgi:hypothetical protein